MDLSSILLDHNPNPQNMKSALLFLLCCLSTGILAQKFPIEWGEVPEEDLQLTECTFDAEADAYILDDHGVMTVYHTSRGAYHQLKHIRRVKILTEAGIERGDIVIPYYTGDRAEKIESIQAQTINSHGIVRPVNKNDFFHEQVSENWSTVSFSFRDVAIGSILEYEYTLESKHFITLQNWFFQHSLPCRHSSLHVVIPPTMGYVSITNGGAFLEQEVTKQRIHNPTYIHQAQEETHTKYTLKNSVGLREEPYATDLDNYRISIEFQLQEITGSTFKQKVIPDWEEFSEEIRVHSNIGAQYERQKNYKRLLEAARPIMQSDASTDEKIEQLHAFIAREVQWNGSYRLSTDDDLDDLFVAKTAGSSAINYMFYALLRELGVPSQIVFVGLRANGVLFEYYPILSQFDHAIVMLEYQGQMIFNDIHHPLAPLGLMRPEVHNFRGWVATDASAGWVNIPPSTNGRKFFAQLALADSLEGTLISSLSAYDALDYRRNYDESEPTALRQALDNFSEAETEISATEVRYMDDLSKDLQERIQFQSELQEDLVIIDVLSPSMFRENVLKHEERYYPVDFEYLLKENVDVQIQYDTTLFEIVSYPASKMYTLKEGDAAFRILADTRANTVRLAFKADIPRQRYGVEDYAGLRELFVQMEQSLKEPVVFKRK